MRRGGLILTADVSSKSSLAQLGSTLLFVTGHPLTRRRPTAAVIRFLAWQLKSRTRREVEFNWLGGAKLLVRRGMTGATGNIYCGLHEFVEMSFLLHILRPGDVFLDVGANIGSYTVLASKVCAARSIAFEPDPGAAAHLRRNVALNGLEDLVTVHQVALGQEPGEVRFSVGLDTMNHANPAEGTPVQLVPVQRLDDVEGVEQAVLIKLDVEGFEDKALAGAERVLASPSLLAVQSETRGPVIEGLLARFGFSRIHYDPMSRRLSDQSMGYMASNAIFVRDRQEVERLLAEAPRRRIIGTLV
jgi:FkbM family methyltransferase